MTRRPLHIVAGLIVSVISAVNLSAQAPDVPAIVRAAGDGEIELVRSLLEDGVDVDTVVPGWGTTALIVGADDLEIARLLIAHGADVNHSDVEGKTALMTAAAHAYTSESVTLLLTHGADVHARDSMGRTALFGAAAHQWPDLSNGSLELLLAAGADPNVADHGGVRPIHVSAANSCWGELTTLLRAGADPNVQDVGGRTPLHAAIASGDLSLYLPFVGLIGQPMRWGRVDPKMAFFGLMKTKYSRPMPIVATLLAFGADPDLATNNGWTSLMLMAEYGNPVVDLLQITKGPATVEEVERDLKQLMGEELYSRFSMRIEENLNIIRLLAESGAQTSLLNEQGDSAMDIAARRTDQNGETVAEWLAAIERWRSGEFETE